MGVPDYDEVERLAVSGKDERSVRKALKLKDDLAWMQFLWAGWHVADWDGVVEISRHRKARRIISTLEHTGA